MSSIALCMRLSAPISTFASVIAPDCRRGDDAGADPVVARP
jgi:hypothetical protein